MTFDFDQFVLDIRAATQQADADAAVCALLQDTVSRPDALLQANPGQGEDEVLFYEDDTVSVWWCRFQPHVAMPPHEHKLTVHIAGYAGVETSLLYQRVEERNEKSLQPVGKVEVQPGQVVTLDRDAIHAVYAAGEVPSLALHIYMGPLMKLKRDLFSWESGASVEFSMENFDQMKRPLAQIEERF